MQLRNKLLLAPEQLTKRFRQASRELDAVSLTEQAVALLVNDRFTNPKKALELLNKAIELDPKYVFSYRARGFAYADLNQYAKAILDFNKAIELDPDYVEAYVLRGLLFISFMDLNDRGCEDLRKACELGDCRAWQRGWEEGYCF